MNEEKNPFEAPFDNCEPPLAEDDATIRYLNEADKELNHVMWEVWGLMESEEICVVLYDEESGIKLAKKCKSPCVYPKMHDRVFGIDMDDLNVSKRISNEIFKEYSE